VAAGTELRCRPRAASWLSGSPLAGVTVIVAGEPTKPSSRELAACTLPVASVQARKMRHLSARQHRVPEWFDAVHRVGEGKRQRHRDTRTGRRDGRVGAIAGVRVPGERVALYDPHLDQGRDATTLYRHDVPAVQAAQPGGRLGHHAKPRF
jgi:hypothetical protein